MPWVTGTDDVRVLSLSKYGIKGIANITYYEDTYGKHMVVLRMGQPLPEKGTLNELFVYECDSEVRMVLIVHINYIIQLRHFNFFFGGGGGGGGGAHTITM